MKNSDILTGTGSPHFLLPLWTALWLVSEGEKQGEEPTTQIEGMEKCCLGIWEIQLKTHCHAEFGGSIRFFLF